MGSVQGGETGGWRAFPDEVSQDLEDLRGVGDHGDDFHGLVTTRAAQGVRLVDLLDQAGPCGAALPGRHRQLWLRLVGRTDAGGWLGLMVALPTVGSEAEEVRATGPRATSPRGVQPIDRITEVVSVPDLASAQSSCLSPLDRMRQPGC